MVAKVARIGRKDYIREELPPTTWRQDIEALAKWVAMGLLGWVIWGPLIYFAFRL